MAKYKRLVHEARVTQDGERAIITVETEIFHAYPCRMCHKPMLSRYMKQEYRNHLDTFEAAGIMVGFGSDSFSEDSLFDGICRACMARGVVSVPCHVCKSATTRLADLAIHITFRPKYPDDTTDHEYICRTCLKERPQKVIQAMLQADHAEDYRPPTS
jgi:hypothetical protein